MNTELYWQAVKAKDARFNGAFVFAVRTTGIFCKPSCSARLPKPENVEFFDAPELAESGGFRACLRCKPKQSSAADPQVDAVLTVCELLDADAEHSLESLSAETGLSSSHLQRIFKDIVGVSPKKYAESRRLTRFKSEIREGSDVVTAMYESGFGSSSRLYEKAVENLGMTPAVYRKGGKGMNINYVITDCELGRLLVARTSRGICSVTFGDSDESLADSLKNEFPNAAISSDDHDLGNAVDAIISYLAGKNKRLVLPLDLQATSFQMQVWDLLRKIPYGETRSYAEIAAELGDTKKVRAVARACATNRVALLIPCHRVVASDGKLSGYRWGIDRKKTLLENEKAA